MSEDTKNIELDDDHFHKTEDSQKDKYLTFHLAGTDYGIDIAFVTEIVGVQKITDVPDMSDFIKGVINLRGKVIPVMDVRLRFHLEEKEYDERTCIVVVDINSTAVGLVVDEVSEVAVIPQGQVEPPPKTGQGESSRYLKGMGIINDEVKVLLNVEMLLFDDELAALESAA